MEAYIAEKGWPTFGDVRYDHLETAEQRGILERAVNAARDFIQAVKGGEPYGLILLSGPVEGDSYCTGYGCGKTMLAQIVFYTLHKVQYAAEIPGEMWIVPTGSFFDARQIMALFDDDTFSRESTFRELRSPVIIDDVGREGALRWERRDPESQLHEKRDRYYSVIDYCYQQRINLVLTTNMTSDELAGFLGGASISRLQEMCPPRFRINMTGLPDMRPILSGVSR